MRVRKTKECDPKDEKYRHVAPEAVDRLDAWLRAAGITEGPLFRGITTDGQINPVALGAGEVARVFKRLARRGGVQDVSRIAGHSTRIGAVHDLKRSGADVLDIMHEGGWRSLMPQRYLQGLASDLGAMARMADGRRHRTRGFG